MKLATALALLVLSGCSLIPVRASHHASMRQYCRQAAEQGWCSESCGNRQPAECFPGRLAGCSDAMCVYKLRDGSLAFVAAGF